jgi:hypothetical protein
MDKERDLLARAGLVIAQHRWSHPEDQALHQLSHQINAYFEEPDEGIIDFCDTHCTWLDHHPSCPLKEKYGGKSE